MAESGTRATLASDLRKMAPVWGIVVATAIIVAFSMKYIGRTQLRRAALGNGSACDYAEVYLSGARARMSGRRDVAARLRYEKRELDKPSLGLLKDDDILIGVKNDLERASALCPTNSEADWTLAVADWYLGDQCAALYHLGTAERRSGRLPEALIQHSLALEVCPDDVPNLLGKAACLRELNRIDEAVALVHEHGDQLTAAPEGKLIVGRVLSQTTETLTAEKLLAEGLVSNPADVHAVMDYVKVMKDSDRPEEGADFLMALGRQDVPTIAQVYHIAAITYREQKKLPKEENALRDALKLFPNSAALCYDLSVNLYIQGKKAEAREMAKRAIDYDVNVLQQIKDNGLDPRS